MFCSMTSIPGQVSAHKLNHVPLQGRPWRGEWGANRGNRPGPCTLGSPAVGRSGHGDSALPPASCLAARHPSSPTTKSATQSGAFSHSALHLPPPPTKSVTGFFVSGGRALQRLICPRPHTLLGSSLFLGILEDLPVILVLYPFYGLWRPALFSIYI